jgi:hypothetical protein
MSFLLGGEAQRTSLPVFVSWPRMLVEGRESRPSFHEEMTGPYLLVAYELKQLSVVA